MLNSVWDFLDRSREGSVGKIKLCSLRMLDVTDAPETALYSSFIWERKKQIKKVKCLAHGKTNTSWILAQLS